MIDVEELDRQNDFCVFITDKRQVRENILFLTRKQLIIGVGCRKDVELNLVEQAINEAKKMADCEDLKIKALVSTIVKQNEKALHQWAEKYKVETHFMII